MTAAQPGAYRDIAEIKLKYPLLDVVERAGVRLRRAGARRWQGLCPFHEDHNPSFFVDVEDQRFVCFGCKSRGDVLDFVRMQSISTPSVRRAPGSPERLCHRRGSESPRLL